MRYYDNEKRNQRVTYERNLLMPFRLRQIPANDKLSHHLILHAFADCYPLEMVASVLSDCRSWEKRERALNMATIMYLIMALSLFPRHNSIEVLEIMAKGALYVRPDLDSELPTAAAISTRRKNLQVMPMRKLFRACCRPMATQDTEGAFVLGRRIMAIDGTLQDVPDVQENALHFGRISSGPSQSPSSQLRAVYLAECGTHAIVDTVLAACHNNEQVMAWSLLRSITPEMLVTMDRGFFSALFIEALLGKGAHVLGRLQSNMLMHQPSPQQRLADGSWLHTITTKPLRGLSQPLTLRIIAYQVINADLPQFHQIQRLVTTILDPEQISAQALVDLYHERWEIELVIDEHKTHQRLALQPLRSRTVAGCYNVRDAHGPYAIRHLMHQAALSADLNPDRLSFTHAVHVVENSLQDFGQTDPRDYPVLKERLMRDLLKHLVPPRTLRFVPRVVKRPLSSFRRKRWWHQDVHLKCLSVSQVLLI